MMANITIRNLPDDVKEALRVSAAANGHSMEEEARNLLKGGRALASADATVLRPTSGKRILLIIGGGIARSHPPFARTGL
jgi:phosphopantothenoylcysteine decarboxylase / phosphopantothenate---cysteine ligase